MGAKVDVFRCMGVVGGRVMYSWITEAGNETQPWMSKGACVEFARRHGQTAHFEPQKKSAKEQEKA